MRQVTVLTQLGMALLMLGFSAYAGTPEPRSVPSPYPGGSPFPPGHEPSLTHTVKVFWTTADGMETDIRVEAAGGRPTQFTAWAMKQGNKEFLGGSISEACRYHILLGEEKRDVDPQTRQIVAHGSGCVEVRVFGFKAADLRVPPVVKATYRKDGRELGETSIEAHPVPDKLKAEEMQDQALRIEGLIGRLAISNRPASREPVPTEDVDTPASDPRVIARRAAADLAAYGKAAFPQLLVHLDDGRQSIAFRRALPSDVGDACFCIIRDQVFPLPDDYKGSFYRRGADGELHARPFFLTPALFDRASVSAWLEARRGTPLRDLQVEALQWLIAQEQQIGFATEADNDRYLRPLQRQLERVQAAGS